MNVFEMSFLCQLQKKTQIKLQLSANKNIISFLSYSTETNCKLYVIYRRTVVVVFGRHKNTKLIKFLNIIQLIERNK